MVVDRVSPMVLAIMRSASFVVTRCARLRSPNRRAAKHVGKVKTVLQMVTIIFYYFAMALAPADGVGVISYTTQVLCWARCCAAASSGCIYLWQNRSCYAGKMMLPPCNRLSGRL